MPKKSDIDEHFDLKLDLTSEITRREILKQEQEYIDTVNFTNDPNAPKNKINPAIEEQYIQAKEPSLDLIKLQEYKERQMEEFTSNYSISQVIPNGWSVFFNIINTIFLILALIIAFFVCFGLIFGLKIGIVPTTSMEPTIGENALVIIKPVESLDDLRIDDIISYNYEDSAIPYIHRITDINRTNGLITLKGDNPNFDGQHYIYFNSVNGIMALNIPVIGSVFRWIKENIYLAVSIMITFIVLMLLVRSLIEHKHAKKEVARFLQRKAEIEESAERKFLQQKAKDEAKEYNDLINKDFKKDD